MNLLIVDDDKLVCMTLAAIFEESKINTDVAYSGAEAYSLLNEKPYDVMITDIVMPDIDGFTLIKRVRSKYKKLRIIMMSGLVGINDMQSFIDSEQAEIEHILYKPFDPAKLLALVNTTV